jgi:penicillin-binding protein 1A
VRRWLIVTIVIGLAVAVWGACLAAIDGAHAVASELDRAASRAQFASRAQTTTVYDRHGRPAFAFFVERRTDIPLDEVSPHMTAALIAIEDRRFYSHHGVDPIRITSAAWRNLRAGRIVQGGSTITQQLARTVQLSPVRTYDRKLREVLLAVRMEERYSKAEILERYLNAVYFGQGFYGIDAASHGYFDKNARDLEPHEAALLAALVRSPSLDAPAVSPKRALTRRNLVLGLMRRQGRLTEEQCQRGLAAPLPTASRRAANGTTMEPGGPVSGQYFEEEVRRQLVGLFGSDRVWRGGLKVYSTYDPERQLDAERVIATRIAQITKARPAARDLQGSLVAMDPATGDVLALVGGRDFQASSFNRATQAHRQAGSAFKPIIYAAAIERGYTPGTLLRDLDAPIAGADKAWLPSGTHERSEYTLRNALKVSSNRAAAQLLQQVGVTTAVYYAHRLGIESQMPMVPSLALGTGEMTLLELTAAYTAFANQGRLSAPRLITRVEDSKGNTIYEVPERHAQALRPTTAFLMSSMLSDVITSGTGTAVRAQGFKLPAAGKTGTTDDFTDAWFVGYTPHLVTGVWFGLDRPAPIMRGGFAGVVAVPAWGQFMRAATAGAKPDWYEMPADIEKVAICRLSGARATDGCRRQVYVSATGLMVEPSQDGTDTDSAALPAVARVLPAGTPTSTVYEDYFPIGTVPADLCPIHRDGAQTIGTSGDRTTPMVDGILRQPTPVSMEQPASPARGDDIVTERVLGADGLLHVVMRQRR